MLFNILIFWLCANIVLQESYSFVVSGLPPLTKQRPTISSKTVRTRTTTTTNIRNRKKNTESSALKNPIIDDGAKTKTKPKTNGNKWQSSPPPSSPTVLGAGAGAGAGNTDMIQNKERGRKQQQPIFSYTPRAGEIIETKRARKNFRQILDRPPSSPQSPAPSSSITVTIIALVSSLLAIEIGTRMTQNLHLAISTQLLSTHFWTTIAPFASMALKLSPMPTILRIRKSNKIGGLPLLPYTAMANLTFALVAYGIMTKDPKVFFTHGAGFIVSSFYCFQFIRHCPINASNLPGTPSLHKNISLIIMTSILCCVAFLKKSLATRVVGMAGVLLSCTMYAGPLSKLRNAIREKSARDVPLPFAIAGAVNSFSWIVYGYIVKKDFVLWFPCAVGFLSSLAQILLNVLWGGREQEQLANNKYSADLSRSAC